MPNILRSKGNRTMNFGQLIECNVRKIFLEKSCTKCHGETCPRHVSEKLKLSIFLDQKSKVLYSLFLLHVKLRAIETYWNESANHFLLPHFTFLKKIKTGLGIVSLPHYPRSFLRKIFVLLYSINWPSFIGWLPLLLEILVNMCIAIVS